MFYQISRKLVSGLMVVLVVLAIFASLAIPKTVQAMSCGKLGSYTTWYYSGVERIWKPILYVWKGTGKPNPVYVSVLYSGEYVPNANNGIITSSPQVDDGSGWVGYFIAKRWYLTHWNWDDDGRWEVRACIP